MQYFIEASSNVESQLLTRLNDVVVADQTGCNFTVADTTSIDKKQCLSFEWVLDYSKASQDAKLIIEKIVINNQLIDNNKLIYTPAEESKQYADRHPNAVTLHNGNITWPGKIYCYFTVMEKRNVVEQKKLVGQNMMRMYNIIYV